MPILIISANPLFVEAITAALPPLLRGNLRSALPEDALVAVQADHPQTLLIDEAIPPELLGQIFKHAQALAETRLVLLNCSSNDFITFDSHPATIGEVSDLVKSIQAAEPPPTEKDGGVR